MTQETTTPFIYNLLTNDFIDRIVSLLQRFGNADLALHDVPIRVVFCDMTDSDKVDRIEDYAQEFFLDRVAYIDNRSFALHVTGMTDDPDNPTATIEAAEIVRKPGTEQTIVVRRDCYANPPYIPPIGLTPVVMLLEYAARLPDSECLVPRSPLSGDEKVNLPEKMAEFFPETYKELVRQLLVRSEPDNVAGDDERPKSRSRRQD